MIVYKSNWRVSTIALKEWEWTQRSRFKCTVRNLISPRRASYFRVKSEGRLEFQSCPSSCHSFCLPRTHIHSPSPASHSVCPPVSVSFCPSLFLYLSVWLSVCLSVCLSLKVSISTASKWLLSYSQSQYTDSKWKETREEVEWDTEKS